MVILAAVVALGWQTIAPVGPSQSDYSVVVFKGKTEPTQKQRLAIAKGDQATLDLAFPKVKVLQNPQIRVYCVPDPGTDQVKKRSEDLFSALEKQKMGKQPFSLLELFETKEKSTDYLSILPTGGYPVDGSTKLALSINRDIKFSHGGREISIPYWDQSNQRPQDKLSSAGAITFGKAVPAGSGSDVVVPEVGYRVFVAGDVSANRQPRIVQSAFKLLDDDAQAEAVRAQQKILAMAKEIGGLGDPADFHGKRLADFDGSTKGEMANRLAGNFARDGFKSWQESAEFWRNAQISGVSDLVSVVWRVTDRDPNTVGFVGHILASTSYRK